MATSLHEMGSTRPWPVEPTTGVFTTSIKGLNCTTLMLKIQECRVLETEVIDSVVVGFCRVLYEAVQNRACEIL